MVLDSGHYGVKFDMKKPLPEVWDTRPAWADTRRCAARGEKDAREVYQLASHDDSTDQSFPHGHGRHIQQPKNTETSI